MMLWLAIDDGLQRLQRAVRWRTGFRMDTSRQATDSDFQANYW